MKGSLRFLLFAVVFIGGISSRAQQPLPRSVFEARTIALVNETKTAEVIDGAMEQLTRWGHFTVVDDAESADIVLRFDKKTDREKQSSQSTDEKGTTSWSGGMTFSTHVHMRAYLKGANSPFYTTETEDSKKKAGVSCVARFQKTWIEER